MAKKIWYCFLILFIFIISILVAPNRFSINLIRSTHLDPGNFYRCLSFYALIFYIKYKYVSTTWQLCMEIICVCFGVLCFCLLKSFCNGRLDVNLKLLLYAVRRSLVIHTITVSLKIIFKMTTVVRSVNSYIQKIISLERIRVFFFLFRMLSLSTLLSLMEKKKGVSELNGTFFIL